MTSLKVNSFYNLSTKAPSILGATYKNLKVRSIMDAKTAIKYRDIVSVNNSISNVISGLSGDVNDLTFILFDNDGTDLVLAIEWINEASIELIENAVLRITVETLSNNDSAIINSLLVGAGYKTFTIEQV